MAEKKAYPCSSLKICVRLIQKDFLLFTRIVKRRLINNALWMAMTVYVYEYVGFSTVVGLGLFMACGECADYGFSNVLSRITALVADIRGPRSISYYLTLPLPQYQVFLCIAVSIFLQIFSVVIILLPIAKLVLQSRFDLGHFSFLKTTFIFLSAYIFYAALALLYASMIKSVDQFNNVQTRVRDMLFWIGCYFFTWQRLYEVNYVVAYLDLLNPFVYACEGMRMAIMDVKSPLPFWACCMALLLFAALALCIGTRRLMRQLDCI